MTGKDDKEVEVEEVNKYWLELETPQERRSRLISLYIVHSAMLVFSLGFSIVLTGLQPYLTRLTGLPVDEIIQLFGWMVAINPLGQFVFSPVFGWLTNRLGSIRLLCLVSCLMYIAGNVLYSSISLFPKSESGSYRYGAMFAARLLVGISSANQASIRTYIAGATWRHERNGHIAILSLFQSIGFMVGPAIQSALTPIGCTDDYPTGELKFDMYTISGWLSAGVGLISFILFLPGIFKEHYVAIKEAQYINKETNNTTPLARPDMVAVVSCTFSFFVFLFNFILLETIGTPLCMQQLGWSEETSIQNLGILMSAGAVISMIAYGTVAPLTARFDERLIYIILGLIPMIAGRVAMIPMGGDFPIQKNCTIDDTRHLRGLLDPRLMAAFARETTSCADTTGEGGCCTEQLPWCEYTPAITEVQFYIGYIVSAVSFPYCMAICQAMFSKIIGPRPQGVWMGVLTSVGSLARITGPLFISFVYAFYGTYWTFGTCSLTLVVATVVTMFTYSRLVPLEERVTAAQHNTNL